MEHSNLDDVQPPIFETQYIVSEHDGDENGEETTDTDSKHCDSLQNVPNSVAVTLPVGSIMPTLNGITQAQLPAFNPMLCIESGYIFTYSSGGEVKSTVIQQENILVTPSDTTPLLTTPSVTALPIPVTAPSFTAPSVATPLVAFPSVAATSVTTPSTAISSVTVPSVTFLSDTAPTLQKKSVRKFPRNALQATYLEEASNFSVLTVRCKNISAELHKSKFGSGKFGSCIKFRSNWYTPYEFLALCGIPSKAINTGWKRKIHFEDLSLQLLMDEGILVQHVISCKCALCCDDESGTEPVRLYDPHKRKKRSKEEIEEERRNKQRKVNGKGQINVPRKRGRPRKHFN